MHVWGEDFDFCKVAEIAYEIGDFCKKWGRIQVMDMKEKYGTVRVYTRFGMDSLHCLVYPGYVYNQWGKIMTWLDSTLLHPIFSLMRPLVFKYQVFIYRLAYKRALAKHPSFREEILDSADFEEYLRDL